MDVRKKKPRLHRVSGAFLILKELFSLFTTRNHA